MTDKFIHYEYEGKNLKVPVEQQKEFESKVPSAKMMLTYNDKNYKVPISEVGSFAEKVGADKLTYSAFDDKKEYVPSLSTERYLSFEEPEAFEPAPAIEEVETPSIAASIETPDMTRKEKRQARREEKANDGKVTWGETIKNKTGAMLSGLGKYALDALILSTSGQGMNPRTGEMYEMVDLEERLQNPDVVTKARMDLAKKQEELSKAGEASEEGFFDLAIKGKVGKALQKGLGSTIESLPMTVLASNPYLSTLYGIAMAGSNYIDETIENPDIPEWKRRINATGTAALEYAVEKLADPIAKYIGGKNGAELTEEAAKDLLDRIAKEGSEGIAKRIFNYLKKVGKNTAKDAAGEGLEEVATSLGTDALGSALDAIDGNADYGFSAQWEKMKEENPDASLADFALSKGKEYMDSFIGGALSGTYMAGGAQLVSDGVNLAYEKKADSTIQNLRNSGASKGLQDFYDVDGDVKSAADEVASAFTKDGETAVSREFIDGLSAEQASALAQKADLPMEQRNALQKYAYTKAVQEGLNGKYDDILQENINIQNILIDNVQDNGVVVAGFYNEQPVYIKGGVASNGAVTLPSGENGPVVVINALTGEQQTVRSEDIKYAESTNADEYRTSVETQMRDNDARNRDVWRNTMSVKAKRNDVAQYVGSKILVDLGNGLAEVEVQKMLENGTVLIKGKKGDLGGKSEVMMPAELFYDAISRNEDGSPTLVETPEIEETPEVEAEVEQPTEVVPQGDEDFRGMTTSILINGKPVEVEVTYQDNTSDTITYQYTDENGRTRTGSSTIGAFMTAMQGASEYNPEVVAPEPEVAPETEISGETTPEAPATEPTPIVEQEPVVEEETDWDTLFATDPKAYLEELQRQFGDGAIDIIKGEIQAAQEELDALEKKRGATMNERMANLRKKSALTLKIGSLNELLEYLERKGMAAPAPAPEAETPTAPETTTPTEPETPAEVEPIEETEPEGETPAAEDTGEIVLDNGYIVKDGKIVNPDVIEMPNSPKEANRIFIAEKDGKWGVGWYALMDNNSASWNDTIQLENIRYNSEKEAIEAALKYFEFYRNYGQNKKSDSTKMDAFVQYVKDTYFGNEPMNTPQPIAPIAPIAPTAVDNPIEVAKVKDENLLKQIQRTDLPNEQKQDLAWSIGKQVADLFATREEYDAYAETAPDFGKYNADYERGVDESFTNRQQNTGDSQGNNVPLGNEPKGESNGEGPSTESGDGQSPRDNSGQSSDKGTEAGDKGTAKKGKGKAGKGKVEDKYPARKGNATRKLLINTFGFAEVTIPDSRKNTLNSIYDFMMEMSKMLGISPKSIGQGGWLSVANLRANNHAAAEHSLVTKVADQSVVSATLKYKYAKLRGIAHEWWHALDHALQYFAEGKGKQVASEIPAKRFSGRPEVYQAIQDILKAIKDSGHENRMLGLNAPIRYKHYLVENSELLARAFDEYINNKFAAAGIKIEGTEHFNDAIQPTPEEMAVIAPYFDKLFEVLQEKEGKTAGTSVLYHIAKGMDAISEVKNELGELVAKWAKQGGNIVIVDTAEMNKALAEEGVDTLKTADGVVYGFVKDGAMYLNPSLLNPDTSIHEYTHLWDNALMQLNPALWEKGKKLMKQTSLWNEVINDPNYADIKDNEDLVASEVHSRLVGEKGAEKLSQLEQDARAKGLTKGAKELSILGRLREWLNEATKWLKDAFASWTSEEVEAVSLDDFLNMPLRDLANFTKLPTDGTISNANGEVVARNNGNGQIQFSISTWEDGGRDYLAEWLRNDNTLEEDEKADILARMDEFYENAKKYTDTYVPFGTWSDAAVKYDENGNPLMSVIKANGDYAMNLDFSLVCKKRRPLNRLLRTLINRNAFGTYSLKEREIAEINWILQEHGFEVACALCFVDSKRYRVTNVADVFAALYNKMVKTLAPKGAPIAHFNYSNNPNVEVVENGIDTMPDEQLNWKEFDRLAKKFGPKTVEGKVAAFLRANPSQRRLVDSTDFIESEGFEAVKANNPSLLSLYNSKKGTGGPKASFGDVQYLNDILKREKMFDVEKAYAVGGVRLQSFSDFVPHMYFDYMQLFAELAAKKLPAHAYTKEMLFAKIFGLTGIKINMSLVPAVVEGGIAAGLDADGNYAWADAVKDADGNIIQQAQSFDYDEAVAIQNAEGYSKNCGIIAVGISDEHIRKMLDDPNIPFIIPYHKSSLNAIVARMTNIDKYKDYTKVQNTRKADGSKLEAGTKQFSFNEYLHSLGENGTPQQAAQAYLDWCKENNYIPKFNEFAGHPNYYKLLVDFNTIDVKTGEYTPQSAVTMTFPTQENAFGDVESLIQQGLAEDAAAEEKMDEEMEQVADEVEAMLKRTASEPKLSEKKQLERMAQLADERKAKIDEMASKGDTELVEKSLSLQDNENIEEHTSDSERLNNSGRLYQSTGQGISWDDLANFNPIYEREGESVRQRNLREAKFFSSLNNLTVDERISFYAFVKEYFQNPSGALKARVNEYIKSLRDSGNNELADFAEQFINDELRYREGVSAQAVMRHGLISGATYSISVIEHIFNAFNNDKYNGVLFDRVMNLAKRFGVTVSFRTRGDNGDYFDVLGQYDLHSNTISLDANLLAKGNEEELCRTILHELIHSVVARSNAIMGGNVLDKNNKLIDPTTLPNDVIDGINTLREVYDAIKDDDAFKKEYGAKDLDEMVSEVSNPKFRALLKAKNLWKKFLNGICRILGIKESGSAQTDALTEIESALDKILSSAERGELDSIYANYLGKLPSGLPLSELQKVEDSAVKSMLMADKLFRTGIDPTDVATATAAQTYDRVVSKTWQEFQRQFQDAFRPVRIAIDAIQQETGNIPIEDYENYLLVQNLSSSRSRDEIDNFERRYYSPIIKQVNALIDEVMEKRRLNKTNKKMRAEVYKEVLQYLISKHGLERNKYYQMTKKRKLDPYEQQKEIKVAAKELQDKIDAFNADTTLSDVERELEIRKATDEYNAAVQEIKTREVPDLRDYSGLTSLYGMKPKKFKEAEAEAQKTVDDFEKSLGRVDDPATGDMISQAEAIEKLWERINAATNKTLRHSYESGMLSRQQYEDIRDMFKFYIPLRGFDETTAEDVYAYARFEGNRFNPAVQTAKGRTSVADDPIAIIMNMAESEIAQGNKNRAKQALYNFLLNRAKENNEQNTLMQLEDVWYVKTIDSSGNEVLQIAAPDHEHGETYDEFEERMKTLAESDMAIKSKKGKVDVGMRFQKQMDRSAHYVYLKVNGVEKAIYINGDPKAADAINGKYVPKMTKTMEIVKGVQRVVSSTFTNYSLEFTLRNFFRDMVYSHINIDVRESDPEYRKKFRQNWRHNNVVSVMKLLKAYRAGELDGIALNEDQAAFVEFMKNGGQTGYTLINSVEAHKKDLQRAIARMQNGVVRGGIKDSAVFKYTLGGIELLNEVSELVTRFAAYKTSRDMGRGINKAVNDAKEITVNFNTKGAQDGTGWMGAIARYLGAVKYFFNASVQGVQNLYAMLQKNPIKFGTTVGSIVALGALMPVLQGILWSLVTGDDEDEYWNIPEYDRQNNLCFVVGKGKYVKVPLPIGFREMYGIGDMIAGGVMNKKFVRDPMAVGMDVANKLATIILPINPLEGSANGLSIIESAQDVFLPDFTQGMLQNRTNKDWKGAPIQKEYTYNEHDPQWTKAFKSNPAWLTGLSKWCYEHINIDGKPLDFSPEKMDNTLSNTFGGVYSLIKKAGRTVSMVWNEDSRNMSNIPLIGVIIGSVVDKDERFVNSTYWEMDEYYNDRVKSIKYTAEKFGLTLDDVFKRVPEGEAPAGAHHPKMSKIYGKRNFDFMQEWYLAHKGEGIENEYGEKELGLSQLKTKVKGVENKIKRNENGEPTLEQIEELAMWNNRYEEARRDLVYDLLELD